VSHDKNVASVTQFITEICGAAPISVFPIKRANSDEQGMEEGATGPTEVVNDNLPKPLSFRVYINSKYSEKFFYPQSWYDGIIIE